MEPLELLSGRSFPSNDDYPADEGSLMDFVSNLASRKKNSSSTQAEISALPTKHRIRQMAAPKLIGENEYEGLQVSSKSGTGLSVDALLRGNEKGLRKEVQASVTDICAPFSATKPRASDSTEERVVRKTAYSERSDELGARWEQTVKVNRNSETLDLRDKNLKVTLSAAAMVSKFAPTTDMELEITRLLEGKGSDAAVTAHEEAVLLQDSNLSVEQVKARQQELAKMRSLLFYEQQKRRRINKIKSKSYHRIRKRQQRRQEGDGGDEDDAEGEGQEDVAELQEKEALKRMQERMSLKHKNTSKWAKQQMKAGGQHSSVRAAIGEQLRIGDELIRKANKPSKEDGPVDESSSSESEGEEDEAGEVRKAKAATEALILGIDQDEVNAKSNAGNTGGLMAMKFMQRAASKQREAARAEAQSLLDDLGADNGGEFEDDEDEDDAENDVDNKAVAVSKQGPAPVMMGTTLEVSKLAQAGKRVCVDAAITIQAQAPATTVPTHLENPARVSSVDDFVNPWLEPGATSKATTSASRSRSKSKNNSDGQLDLVDIDKATSEALAGTQHQQTVNAASSKNMQQSGRATDSKGAKDSAAKGVRELSQAELVQRAFASPDFEKEFLDEKREETEGKLTGRQAVEAVSDGWGSWAGMGAPPPRPPPEESNGRNSKRKRQNDTPAPPPKATARGADTLDRNMPLVIVSKKRIKAAARLKVGEVPYPFTSREQYERTLAVPAGKEWNGMRAARGFARPAVVTNMGRTIAPIKAGKQTQRKSQPRKAT
mmetsp:Transcript_42237/g.83172  ORF Transcript_42237/g.83172 Transcript_42237/m.83172 type:complete len:774 (-) Transcript_42237:85-2406(-)